MPMLSRNNLHRTLYALASLLSAFIFSVFVIAGATKWLPEGAGGVDHIVIPILSFPVVWTVFALALYGARRRARAWTIVGSVAALNVGLIVYGFVGRGTS